MLIEPLYLIVAGLCLCSFMVGKNWGMLSRNALICATVDHLIEEGYLRSYVNAEGETELIRIRDERNTDGWSRTSTDDQAS